MYLYNKHACNFNRVFVLAYDLLSLLSSFKRSKMLPTSSTYSGSLSALYFCKQYCRSSKIQSTSVICNHIHQIFILNQRIYILKWVQPAPILKKQSYFGWNSFYLSKKNVLNQTWKSFNTKSRPQWENSIFIFQEFFARIYKIFISEERLDTRL